MSEILLEEFIKISGDEPDEMVLMLINACTEPENFHWEKTGVANFPYALIRNEEFDAFKPSADETNFGVEAKEDPDQYVYDEFSVPGDPSTARLKETSHNTGLAAMRITDILSEKNRDKLLINHNGSAKSARHILDGFTIENLVSAYAEEFTNEDVCRYLRIKPSQLKSWLAMSQQRMAIISRLKDIMRSQKVDDAIDDSLDYEVGDVFDKADEAMEKLKLDCIKMRSKNALELDKRSRGADNSDGGSLPVVNIGLSVNNNNLGGKSLDSVKPVIPGVVVTKD